MSDVEFWDQSENPHFKNLFENEWKKSTEIQKLWFLNRINEIEKLSLRYDRLRIFRNSVDYRQNDFSNKELIVFRLFIIIFVISFFYTIYLIDNIKYLIVSVTIFYLIFKFMSFLRNLDEYGFVKNDNFIKYQNSYEISEIENFFRTKTEIDSIYMEIYSNYSNEDSLNFYVKNSMRFRYHLLIGCKKDLF
jgi:hypothetical protein